MTAEFNKLHELHELLENFDVAMLTTVTNEGLLISRPMAVQHSEVNGTQLWFVTSVDTEKALDIENEPRVNLGYYKDSNKMWMSIAGRARLVRSSEHVQKLWKEEWRVWFPNGKDDPSLALLQVEPLHVTYWQPDGGQIKTLYSIAKGYFTGEFPNLPPPKDIEFNTSISS